MTRVLTGRPVADVLMEACRTRAAALADRGRTARLAIVRVGDSDADLWYQNAATRRLESVGAEVRVEALPSDASQALLEGCLDRLSVDPAVDGVLLMRPLPAGLDEAAAAAHLDPAKDVDGMGPASMAGVYAGDPAAFAPCTADAVMAVLDHYGFEYRGARCCVLGRSLVVGRPVAMLLLARDATVTLCHSRTLDAADACRGVDLVVSAVGRAGHVTADFLAPGSWFVDVGTNRAPDGSMVGDGDWDAVEGACAAATPVPGGVGAVTTAVLAAHVLSAAERRALD